MDIRNSVDMQQIMTDYSLGPERRADIRERPHSEQAALRYQEEIDSTTADFVVVDTPGQIELFAFRESGPFIAKGLQADSKVLLFLMDSLVASSPTNFLSLALLSTSVQLRMELPHIQVLSKTDLAKEKVPEMMRWSKDSLAYEDAGSSELKSGTEYSFDSQLFRPQEVLPLARPVPVSSYSRRGFIGLDRRVARFFGGGEEYEE